ncbi:MAG: bifunctional 5,10-methylenetetrahydrofolate dehydrogenase/5,10-methenyltetrahydrofolate cyclohydrolase [Oscillospiraceae bacterium]|nr:bifunctional 5,10-methylenetetrahydrofolate dehydrogenase/5,10-methenyltetrahydrofolate cyclohydrolase [Oscillospiraceae bacterium]
MAEKWKGAPAAAALDERTAAAAAALRETGVVPTLAILRVGERESDLSYERGAVKRCAQTGIAVRPVTLPETVDSGSFFRTLEDLNRDAAVHGILMLRPLPEHLDGERARRLLAPEKDVDGCTDGSLAGVFTGMPTGFPPCTAQAVMELLRYYGTDPAGRRAVVLGRSLVIGRPVAMLLLHANATVTVCHTKTPDAAALAREADILVAATGQMERVGAEYLRPGQVVLDVGIGWNEAKGKLCGDLIQEEAEGIVRAYTPVPGGVGGMTTSVLASHVAEAARRASQAG